MIVYDNITITASNRKTDKNGFLKVKACNLTKEQVAPYYGDEIPNWKDFDLEAKKVYYVYRPETEIAKAVDTFNNLPLTRDHIEVDVNNVPKERIVGSLGDHAEYKAPYLKNSLIVYDQTDIDNILDGKKKELSCGYRYTPVRKSGEWHGQHYDFVMTDIIGNHVALVREGRAGHDVVVADGMPDFTKDSRENIIEEKVLNMVKDLKEIPDEQDKPETAGDVKAEKEDKTMDEVKTNALAEDKCAKDEESKEEKKEEKTFAEGVDYGEEKEKKEPKKLDSEHESEGAKKADEKKKDEKEAEDKCTKDSALTMDVDAIKAQVRAEMVEDFKAREEARKSVEPIIGDVNVMAFDSCNDIYKLACEKEGLPVNEIVSYKDALTGYMAGKAKLAEDASPVSGSNEECFKDIRV